MTIKILGRGQCKYCRIMQERTQRALKEADIDAAVERIEDPQEMYAYGILAMPVLIIDDTIVAQGKVPPVDMLKKLIIERN
jgi:glutaredoxin